MPLGVRAALTPPEMHEWRNGRRAGFRNRCPRGICEFKSHLVHQCALLAQQEEQRTFNPQAVGSMPTKRTNAKPCIA